MTGFIRQAWRVWRCDHSDKAVSSQYTSGVTMDWQGLPTVQFEWRWTCRQCGFLGESTGILPRRLLSVSLDADGWPLEPNGERMAMVGEGLQEER